MKSASADELAQVLERLIDVHTCLHAVVRQKLEAMRRTDVEGMLAASSQEGRLGSQLKALDGQRRESVSRLCQVLDIKQPDGGAVTLRLLAERLGGTTGGRLLDLADRLRQEMFRLAEANTVAQLVCREMLVHFKNVFAAMVQDEGAAPTYSACGASDRIVGSRVLDAVG